MPKLGAHVSIAGGIDEAIVRGSRLRCETIQIFTKSNNQWAARPLSEEEALHFHQLRKQSGIDPVFAHDAYLINLCASNPKIRAASEKSFEEELERAGKLGLAFLVMHPGAHMGMGEERAIHQLARTLNHIFSRLPDNPVKVLLETTAGQGTQIGYRFEHLREIRRQIQEKARVGVCIDTCHLFAAGYDIRTESGYEETMKRFDRIVGLSHVKAFHLNDSKKPLGSRVDRHEHIGKGFLGKKPFQLILNDPRFGSLPMVLETPKGKDLKDDRTNLRFLRSLLGDSSREQ